MARKKDQNGLTPQQEAFCRAYVEAYGTTEHGILVAAYRKAYNCRKESRKDTHYTEAHRLKNDPQITLRISQLEEEQRRLVSFSKEEMISRNANILKADPLRLMKADPETGDLVFKNLNEIPRQLRLLVTPITVQGKVVYVLDKKTAQQVLIDICGYDAPRDINLNNMGSVNGELRIGFEDSDEEEME